MNTALLFDFDGVIVDSEKIYSVFWEDIGVRYLHVNGFSKEVKGSTLKQILSSYFLSKEIDVKQVVSELAELERGMSYDYIPGVIEFVKMTREIGYKSAIVTSSDIPKMNCVYAKRPELKTLFDAVLTSEDFAASKPDPDCFLKGMERLVSDKMHTVIFEDSINGLKAAQASCAHVIGLTTTNPPEIVRQYSEFQIPNFNNAETILSTISALCD